MSKEEPNSMATYKNQKPASGLEAVWMGSYKYR
jgi:hypothetical protein